VIRRSRVVRRRSNLQLQRLQGGFEYPICQTVRSATVGLQSARMLRVRILFHRRAPMRRASHAELGPSCELLFAAKTGLHYGQAMCPMCAAPDTPIATPAGARAISELAPGDLVYSVDETGSSSFRSSRRQHASRQSSCRSPRASRWDRARDQCGHRPQTAAPSPTCSTAGSSTGRHHFCRNRPYTPFRTYDILPNSRSGQYFAGGALIGSTLVAPFSRRDHELLSGGAAAAVFDGMRTGLTLELGRHAQDALASGGWVRWALLSMLPLAVLGACGKSHSTAGGTGIPAPVERGARCGGRGRRADANRADTRGGPVFA